MSRALALIICLLVSGSAAAQSTLLGAGTRGNSPPVPTPTPTPSPTPTAPPNGTSSALAVGAGGFIRGIDIEDDGVNPEIILNRTDTYGGYIWDTTLNRWRQLVTATTMPVENLTVDNNFGVVEIRAAPSNTNIIFMNYNGIIYKSVDRGAHFLRAGNRAQCTGDNANSGVSQHGPFIAIDPINPNIVYVGCQQGTVANTVMVTLDGGDTWDTVPLGVVADAGGAGIMFDKTSGSTNGATNTIWIAVSTAGVYRSQDAGATFVKTHGSPTTFTNLSMVGSTLIVPNSAVSFNYYAGDVTGWQSQTTAGDQEIIAVLANPANPNQMITLDPGGGTTISVHGLAGPFGGVQDWTWQADSTTTPDITWLGWAQTASPFLDVGQAAWDPAQPGTLLVTGGIGVWRLTPVFLNVTPITYYAQARGIEQLVAKRIKSIPGGPPVLTVWDRAVWYIGNFNVYPSHYGPSYEAAVGAIVHGYDFAWQPGNPTHICGIFQHFKELSSCSWDGGQTWKAFPSYPGSFLGSGQEGGSLAMDNRGNIVWSPPNDFMHQTSDGGLDWNPLDGTFGFTNVGSTGWSFAYYLEHYNLTADKVFDQTFYAYNTNTGVWRSQDGGVTWTNVSKDLMGYPGYYNSDIEASPLQGGYLWYSAGPQSPGPHPVYQFFYQSNDGGVTWTTVPNVMEARFYGFGAPAPGRTNPSMWICGYVNGVYGIWESDDATLQQQTPAPTWTLVNVWPIDSFDNVNTVSGDLNQYGLGFVGFQGSGYAYIHTHDYVPKPMVSFQSVITTANSAAVTWQTPIEPSSSVLNYGLTNTYGSQITGPMTSTPSANITSLANFTTYHFNIVQTDAAGNSFTSYDQTFQTLNAIAPNPPTALTAVAVQKYQINLAWTNNIGNDPQAMVGVIINRDGTQIANVPAPLTNTFQDLGVVPGSTHCYTVQTYDASNNVSPPSAQACASTAPGLSIAVTATPTPIYNSFGPAVSTFTNQNLGPASPDRIIFILEQANNAANVTEPVVSVTVCGQPATALGQSYGKQAFALSSFWMIQMPTGTACDIVVTQAGNNNYEAILVAAMHGQQSNTPYQVMPQNDLGYQPNTFITCGDLTIPNNGAAFSFAMTYVDNYAGWQSSYSTGGFNDTTGSNNNLQVGHMFVPGSYTAANQNQIQMLLNNAYATGGMYQVIWQ